MKVFLLFHQNYVRLPLMGRFATDLNDLYRRVIIRNNRLKINGD
jgi:hypothetical protein